MVVQHNISAMTANRYYGVNNKSLAGSLEKLASGYAINRAGDNAAGLAVSEKMRAQIGGLTQASKNAEDGISMVQTFEGALQETDSILQRMRTLAVQSANGSYQNDVDRDAIQLEFDQLNDELNQIADTDYNGVVMLNGGVMADGTVANDPSKIAAKPNIENVKTSPDAAFTYKSLVNGTVDTAGNGKMTINGVNIKLEKGAGEAVLGNDTAGKTTYTAKDIKVTDGLVSGTVEAEETYKIDSARTNIEIHGNNYSIANGGLKDSDGNDVKTIDGLVVTVNDGESVALKGSYEIKDSKIETKSFENDKSTDVTNGNTITGVTDWKGNAKIAGSNVTVDDTSTNYADAVLQVNGATIGVDDGQGTGTVGSVTYTAGSGTSPATDNITVNEASGKVTGKVEATGSVSAYDEKSDLTVTTRYYGLDGKEIEESAWAATLGTGLTAADNGKTAKAVYSITDNVTGKSYELHQIYTVSGGALGTTATYKDGTGAAITPTTAGGIFLQSDGTLKATADTDSNSKVEISELATTVGTKVTFGKQVNKSATDEGLGHDTKVYLNWGASGTSDKFIAVKGDDAVFSTNKGEAGLSNGLKLTISSGAISVAGSFTIDDTLDIDSKGEFNIKQGVSTSDAYNHGAGNLTFADSMTLQVGARSKDAVNFNFSYTTNGIGTLKADMNASARGLGTDQLSVSNQEDANFAIDQIDNALNKVNMIRATFGSVQNRLEHKINNIDTNTENLTAAESRIRDTQMDKEMMKFTSSQILSQASQSMLAQANQLPQGVLQLLG